MATTPYNALMKPHNIRALRDRLQMTQEQFAQALGLADKHTVSKLENGSRRPGGALAVLLELAAAHPSWLKQRLASRRAG